MDTIKVLDTEFKDLENLGFVKINNSSTTYGNKYIYMKKDYPFIIHHFTGDTNGRIQDLAIWNDWCYIFMEYKDSTISSLLDVHRQTVIEAFKRFHEAEPDIDISLLKKYLTDSELLYLEL